MPIYMCHFMCQLINREDDGTNIWCHVNFYINTTNSKSFEKYKITPIDAKIVSYFLNNVCF